MGGSYRIHDTLLVLCISLEGGVAADSFSHANHLPPGKISISVARRGDRISFGLRDEAREEVSGATPDCYELSPNCERSAIEKNILRCIWYLLWCQVKCTNPSPCMRPIRGQKNRALIIPGLTQHNFELLIVG